MTKVGHNSDFPQKASYTDNSTYTRKLNSNRHFGTTKQFWLANWRLIPRLSEYTAYGKLAVIFTLKTLNSANSPSFSHLTKLVRLNSLILRPFMCFHSECVYSFSLSLALSLFSTDRQYSNFSLFQRMANGARNGQLYIIHSPHRQKKYHINPCWSNSYSPTQESCFKKLVAVNIQRSQYIWLLSYLKFVFNTYYFVFVLYLYVDAHAMDIPQAAYCCFIR